MNYLRLGVNIDHVATVRNARGGDNPDPIRAALLALEAGADGITLHLREDRRHIRDDDLKRLADAITAPINLEMAVTSEMLAIALAAKPHAVCLVPERREEVTTEGGLDAAGMIDRLASYCAQLAAAGIRVSLFIDPEERQIEAAKHVGAPVVELHTGAYGHASGAAQAEELCRLQRSAKSASALGVECHAGHGLTFENVTPVAAIAELAELNIGHFLVGEAIFTGFGPAIRHMKELMATARS
jgi:pyridoxine 5-phosphate synthase